MTEPKPFEAWVDVHSTNAKDDYPAGRVPVQCVLHEDALAAIEAAREEGREQGRIGEREAVVEWLDGINTYAVVGLAVVIERGEHR